MNDSTEHTWIHEVAKMVFAKDNRRPYSMDIHDMFAELEAGYAMPWDRPPLFIGCFSTQGDQLSQWRAYAGDGSGFVIGFNRECFPVPSSLTLDRISVMQGLTVALDRVVYDETLQVSLLFRLLNELERLLNTPSNSVYARDAFIGTGVDCLQYMAQFLKHPGFCEEQEWRLVLSGFGNDNPREFGISPETKQRRRGDETILYHEFDFATDRTGQPIREVIIGPKNPSSAEDAQKLIETCGYHGATVRKSRIPYR